MDDVQFSYDNTMDAPAMDNADVSGGMEQDQTDNVMFAYDMDSPQPEQDASGEGNEYTEHQRYLDDTRASVLENLEQHGIDVETGGVWFDAAYQQAAEVVEDWTRQSIEYLDSVGPEADANLQAIGQVLGGEAAFWSAIGSTGLGYHPAVIEAFNKLGAALRRGEVAAPVGGGNQAGGIERDETGQVLFNFGSM